MFFFGLGPLIYSNMSPYLSNTLHLATIEGKRLGPLIEEKETDKRTSQYPSSSSTPSPFSPKTDSSRAVSYIPKHHFPESSTHHPQIPHRRPNLRPSQTLPTLAHANASSPAHQTPQKLTPTPSRFHNLHRPRFRRRPRFRQRKRPRHKPHQCRSHTS